MDSWLPLGLPIAGIVLGLGYAIWRHYFRRCPRCDGRLRMSDYRDSMGWNLTKTITLSLWKGPRKNTEIWKCKDCGHEESESTWNLS